MKIINASLVNNLVKNAKTEMPIFVFNAKAHYKNH